MISAIFPSCENHYNMNTILYEWSFALFSAHIHHFLPDIPWQEHEDLYQRFEAFHTPKQYEFLRVEHTSDVQELLQLEPALLCLYHLGNHFETVLALGKISLAFDLLLDREVYKRNEKAFLALQAQLKSNGNEYRFLFSDDRAVLLKMRTALQKRRHVVVFADGNSGTRGSKDLRIAVRFLHGTLQVKQGIAMISHLLQVPIIPLWMKKKQPVYILSMAHRIDPTTWESRLDYIRYGMQSLYDQLAKEIAGHPWKWECWRYLHRNGTFDPADLHSFREQQTGAEEAWIPIPWQGQMAYFDRVSYQLIH